MIFERFEWSFLFTWCLLVVSCFGVLLVVPYFKSFFTINASIHKKLSITSIYLHCIGNNGKWKLLNRKKNSTWNRTKKNQNLLMIFNGRMHKISIHFGFVNIERFCFWKIVYGSGTGYGCIVVIGNGFLFNLNRKKKILLLNFKNLWFYPFTYIHFKWF